MTNQDLRAKYKKDTGVYAVIEVTERVELDENLTIYDLGYPIDVDVEIVLEKVPCIIWLEEQLILKS